MSSYFETWFGNFTSADDDFTSHLQPASDISVDTVMTSLYFNLVVFAVLMASYEILRRLLPSVYAARRQRDQNQQRPAANGRAGLMREPSLGGFSDESVTPLNWVMPVFGVSWDKVRRVAGLDGYFFLRYIRMCFRITFVSTFWACVILIPVLATGHAGSQGWYHISMNNIETGNWRMWVPVVFIYLFTGFCFFVMKQEYRHFIELRMNFLAKGDTNIDEQQRYSIMVENIPVELRSDRALFDYFNKLFPGKVHSASVVLNLPDLETLVMRRDRIVHRLENSIAYFHATGEKPTHIQGRRRLNCCGIHLAPLDCNCSSDSAAVHVDLTSPLPEKGTRVDSISYYARELADCNKQVYLLQQQKTEVAQSGNVSVRADNWLTTIADFANDIAGDIMEESLEANALRSPTDSMRDSTNSIPQAELMASQYGSFAFRLDKNSNVGASIPEESELNQRPGVSWDIDGTPSDKSARLVLDDHLDNGLDRTFIAPGGRKKDRGILLRIAGRLGLDFAVAVFKSLNGQMDVVVESVVGRTMSSTGFVTFVDLASVTSAASAPLTHKPNVLSISVAAEPRDVQWKNVHISDKNIARREATTNILLFFGGILWTFPLAAIQAFATAEQLARIPGMDWILTFNGGSLTAFINGYLPVLALLGLICLLPVLFEWIAVSYEHRKTYSDVQRSILGRYFYFQLVNIYVTVTAGSLWRSLADIIERPSSALELLGESLPRVVGYFVSLLITKIFAGLPIVVLRVGALSRMLFLKICFLDDALSQRELDQIYRPYNVMYGWEYPTQLLVIMICFTYACISPVILPFGAIFFAIALMVYKKQLLYVYQPVYQSGGALFPSACDRTLFGLICGQCTLIGYTIIRGAYYQPMVLFPLPCFSIWGMQYFRKHYVRPSSQLSMERAMECDRVSDLRASEVTGSTPGSGEGIRRRRQQFDRNSFRQPVLTFPPEKPLPYRRGIPDELTEQVAEKMLSANRFVFMRDDEEFKKADDSSASMI